MSNLETIITVATVLTMYFNAISNVDVSYMYNADMEDGVINKIEVYEQDANHQMVHKPLPHICEDLSDERSTG